jgi:hypothetical protein
MEKTGKIEIYFFSSQKKRKKMSKPKIPYARFKGTEIWITPWEIKRGPNAKTDQLECVLCVQKISYYRLRDGIDRPYFKHPCDDLGCSDILREEEEKENKQVLAYFAERQVESAHEEGVWHFTSTKTILKPTYSQEMYLINAQRKCFFGDNVVLQKRDDGVYIGRRIEAQHSPMSPELFQIRNDGIYKKLLNFRSRNDKELFGQVIVEYLGWLFHIQRQHDQQIPLIYGPADADGVVEVDFRYSLPFCGRFLPHIEIFVDFDADQFLKVLPRPEDAGATTVYRAKLMRPVEAYKQLYGRENLRYKKIEEFLRGRKSVEFTKKPVFEPPRFSAPPRYQSLISVSSSIIPPQLEPERPRRAAFLAAVVQTKKDVEKINAIELAHERSQARKRSSSATDANAAKKSRTDGDKVSIDIGFIKSSERVQSTTTLASTKKQSSATTEKRTTENVNTKKKKSSLRKPAVNRPSHRSSSVILTGTAKTFETEKDVKGKDWWEGIYERYGGGIKTK